MKWFLRVSFLLFSLMLLALYALTSPTFSSYKKIYTPKTDSLNLITHVDSLCNENEFRTWTNTTELNRAGNYVYREFLKHSRSVRKQAFIDKRNEYFNVISSYGPRDAPRLIIGAHYDVCGNQQGADDNASGVSSLLELGRMLSEINLLLDIRVDLVAYTLEEPPFFRNFMMGSAVHARSLEGENAEVLGMVSIEMIGYYDDAKGSQSYPIKAMKLVYPTRANYISVVSKMGDGDFLRKIKRGLKSQNHVKVKSVIAPASVPGIDFSDHLNYWDRGYKAAMITDTSFYRNGNYHQSGDTPETLDFTRMAHVTDGILSFILAYKI